MDGPRWVRVQQRHPPWSMEPHLDGPRVVERDGLLPGCEEPRLRGEDDGVPAALFWAPAALLALPSFDLVRARGVSDEPPPPVAACSLMKLGSRPALSSRGEGSSTCHAREVPSFRPLVEGPKGPGVAAASSG